MVRARKDKPVLRNYAEAFDMSDMPQKKYPNQVWVDVNQVSFV